MKGNNQRKLDRGGRPPIPFDKTDEQISAFVRKHPRSTAPEIKRGVGNIGIFKTKYRLKKLEKYGFVKRRAILNRFWVYRHVREVHAGDRPGGKE